MTNTAEITANSYIWRPWLANWNGRLAVSRASSESDDLEQTGSVFSGMGQLNLFPRSRFPLQAYADVTDSRIDSSGLSIESSGSRNTRLGLFQSYRPVAGNQRYTARVERNVQEQLSDGQSSTRDYMQADMITRGKQHDFTANMLWLDFQQANPDSQQSSLLLSGTHRYHPQEQLSIDSNASFSLTDQQSASSAASTNTEFQANSHLVWRDLNRPLTARARANLQLRQDGTGSAASESQEASLSGGVEYRFTDALRLNADAGATVRNSDNAVSSFQTASLSYTPDARQLLGFTYNWSASGAVRNEFQTDGSGGQGVSSALSHQIGRSLALGFADWMLSINASQGVTGDLRSPEGSLMTLTHAGSAGLTRAGAGNSSSLRLSATDSLIRGETDTHIQLLNLGGGHNQSLSRNSGWSADFNIGTSSVTSSGELSQNSFSSANASYFHRRFLDYRNLRFQSNLELRSESEQLFNFFMDANRLHWRNEFNYSVGRLDLRLTTNVHQRADGEQDKSIFLSTSRSF
ncbi:hypothetical protein [Sedimenticola hydrogenitrophicus]|uniref:hypothetical protein n=1 Tax=Sedimenticola hydrogenitrophicus TaxID=2967975 RepID=UPI0023AF84B7|nr:hypothetical protein [Sedimenticola hydrogenitrophicus]